MPDPRQQLFDALEDARSRGVFPGCVALVERDGAVLYHEAHGALASHAASVVQGVPVERDTVYDLASLTKVLCTTTLAAIFVSEGRVQLESPVPGHLTRGAEGVTLGRLLEHASGLPAHREFFAAIDPFDAKEVMAAVAGTDREYEPGARAVYSDLGFMILGAWLEELGGRPLDELFRDRIAYALRLDGGDPPRLGFRRLATGGWMPGELERRIAPTEVYETRGRPAPGYHRVRSGVAHGEVHDDNAYVMGGVAGHAGLFGTAEAVAEVARAWLHGTLPGLDPAVRDRFWRPSGVSGSSWRVGWDGPSEGGSTGGALSARAVGHLGFTGCSLWIDPEPPRRIVVLVSNSVHPLRRTDLMGELRPRFHQLAAAL